MANNANQEPDFSPKQEKQIVEVVRKELADPPTSFSELIERKAHARMAWVGGVFTIIVVTLGYLGLDKFGDIAAERAVKQLLDTVLQQTTNTIAQVKDKALQDGKAITSVLESAYTNVIEQTAQTEAFSSEISNYTAQVKSEGEAFLSQVAILKSKGTVVALEDLVKLIHVQYVTNIEEVVKLGFFELDHEPAGGRVQIRVEPMPVGRRGVFLTTEYGVQGKRLQWVPNLTQKTFRSPSNSVMRIEYVIKATFAELPKR